jgi:DNA-binding transcriptional LysR family regulator
MTVHLELILREDRAIDVTPVGDASFAWCRTNLATFEAAVKSIAEKVDGAPLRTTVPDDLLRLRSMLIASLRESHPDVEFKGTVLMPYETTTVGMRRFR